MILKRLGGWKFPGKSGFRLSIGRRLTLGFAAVVLPFLIGSIASYWIADRARKGVHVLLERSDAARLTAELMVNVHSATSSLSGYIRSANVRSVGGMYELTSDESLKRSFEEGWVEINKLTKQIETQTAVESDVDIQKGIREALVNRTGFAGGRVA
jgi:CHASE3 domain sensor protein